MGTAFEVVFGLFIAAMAVLVVLVARWALTRGGAASRGAAYRGAASRRSVSPEDTGTSEGKSTEA